jgi:MFS family permease
MSATKMTSNERRATLSLSIIMGLRMIGLFMVLPLFSLYANSLAGSTPMLIGISMGIYGLFQAIFQITFGAMSDRVGRKPAILAGLIIFTIGSFLSGAATTINMMIIGRTLQGIGAIGSSSLALLADLTREEQRTKSMMVIGISIGFSFSLAMLLGPLLSPWLGVQGLFNAAGWLALIAIAILYIAVPKPVRSTWHSDTEPEYSSFMQLMLVPELARLNAGIFILHAIFTASFVVIPIAMQQVSGINAHDQWQVYLPALLTALVTSGAAMGMAERRKQIRRYFLSSIITLALSLMILWLGNGSVLSLILSIGLFFAGFTLLEGMLPSLISRTAPRAHKGSAMGIYSCAQYSGIFAGGVLGGWIYSQFHFSGVYIFCIGLTLLWFTIAFSMREPRHFVTEVIRLSPSDSDKWELYAAQIRLLQGIVEVTLVAEDNLAYIKMERKTSEEADFIRLKELLQSDTH